MSFFAGGLAAGGCAEDQKRHATGQYPSTQISLNKGLCKKQIPVKVAPKLFLNAVVPSLGKSIAIHAQGASDRFEFGVLGIKMKPSEHKWNRVSFSDS